MNTYADAIRRQAEDAPRAALPAVAKAMWSAFAAGQITEGEAEALSALIEARQLVAGKSGIHNLTEGQVTAKKLGKSGGSLSENPIVTGDRQRGATAVENADRSGISNVGNSHISRSPNSATSSWEIPILPSDRHRSPRTGTGSRPRTDASMERRRRWAASGRLPPALASRFTLAEQAVLALIAAETARRGDCRLAVGHLASMVGVAETTVRNAIREARKLGLLTVEERRVTGFRNLPNVVRIVSPEWVAWLRLARKGVPTRHPPSQGGGCKSAKGTPTRVLKQGKTRPAETSQRRIARTGRPS